MAISPVNTEGRHAGGFIVSEATGFRSRSQGIIENGTGSDVYLNAGTVLSRVEGVATGAAVAGNTGTGVLGAITETGAAIPGVYTLRIHKTGSNAGEFQVTNPAGNLIGEGTVGVAFNSGGLAFTLADGTTDFSLGDSFTITVTDSGKRIVASTTTSPASCILFNEVRIPASGSAKVATVERDAEVNQSELMWGATITTDALKAKAINQLAANGIICR